MPFILGVSVTTLDGLAFLKIIPLLQIAKSFIPKSTPIFILEIEL